MSVVVSAIFRLRRDTAANWTAANPVLQLAEPGLETDTRKVKYGDGATAWNSLAYSSSTPTAADVANTPAGNIAATNVQAALNELDTEKLAASLYTAADVLAKLLTVDGPGSGLDADLLDGQSIAYVLARANHTGTQAWSTLTGTPTTLSGYGITDAQPLAPALTTIASLTATTDNFIVSVASAWASRTPTQVRTTLGLGTSAVIDTGTSGTKVPLLNGAATTWAGTIIVPSGAFRGAHTATPTGSGVEITGGATGNITAYDRGAGAYISLYYDASGFYFRPAGTLRLSVTPAGADVTGALTATTTVRTGSYTVAALPAAATAGAGAGAYVTDALAPTFLTTVVGGGAIATPVFSDGTNWKAG